MVRLISTRSELQSELKNERNRRKLVVLDFYATWCPPCMAVGPQIEEWSARDYKDKVVFLKCDIDKAGPLSQEYRLQSIPTFIFFQDGKEVHRFIGGNIDQLRHEIDFRRRIRSRQN